jgi:drug/metabolite transporter (DMT)-like permease
LAAKQKVFAIAGLLSGAVVWGLVWHPYRLLEQAGIPGDLSSLVTYLVASLLGMVLFRRSLPRLGRVPMALLWLALTAGWANLAYVLAVIGGEVMRVLLLFYLAPLWTVVFSHVLLKERLSREGYLVMLLSLGGAIVMLWDPNGGAPVPQSAAEWLGLSAGVSFALTNVLTRRAQHLAIELKSLGVWFGTCALAAILLAGNPEKLDVLSAMPASIWLLLFAIGLVIFLVTITVQYGLTHTPANQSVVILLFELVVAAVSSYFLAHEVMQLKEWIGGAMIVTASLFSGKVEKRHAEDR